MKLFRSRASRAQGFTLLEVVVAMTIVGLGVVTLLEIFSMGLRLGARSTDRTDAIAQGRQVMDEFLLRQPLTEGSEEGRVDDKTRWQIRVQAVKEAPGTLALSAPWQLMEVDLEMRVNEAGRERRVELKTLRLVRARDSANTR